MSRYEEAAEILAVLTAKVDPWGRVTGLRSYRGKTVRVLVFARDPNSLSEIAAEVERVLAAAGGEGAGARGPGI